MKTLPDIENLLNVEDEVTQVLSDLGVNEKLNEMDDFMNQNDLKVQITNENAVVTGLVTYTCTVKDQNNTALANKVVEWYKGTTLIGIDATDSNGVSTFSHRVTEADIYDVHAIVRGTHAGDDIRMFVKDNANLCSFNQWSCGEYLNNLLNLWIGGGITASVSSEWSHKGHKSLKMVQSGSSGYYVRVETNYSEVNQTLTASLNCINKDYEFQMWVYQLDENETELARQYITVPVDSDVQSPSIEITTVENIAKIRIAISCTNHIGQIIFIDNLNLSKR